MTPIATIVNQFFSESWISFPQCTMYDHQWLQCNLWQCRNRVLLRTRSPPQCNTRYSYTGSVLVECTYHNTIYRYLQHTIQLPSQGIWRTGFWSSWQPLGRKLISDYHLNLQRYWNGLSKPKVLSITTGLQRFLSRSSSSDKFVITGCSHNNSAICSILYTIFKALWPGMARFTRPVDNLSRLD